MTRQRIVSNGMGKIMIAYEFEYRHRHVIIVLVFIAEGADDGKGCSGFW
jgi:hypothetical protein